MMVYGRQHPPCLLALSLINAMVIVVVAQTGQFSLKPTPDQSVECPCETKWEPVCGLDDFTYGNECSAYCAGIPDFAFGECGGGNSLNTYTGCSCGNYFLPVCAVGEDECPPDTPCFKGQTYYNPCQARCAGKPLWVDGACNYQGCAISGCPAGKVCVNSLQGAVCMEHIPLGHYCKLSDRGRCAPGTVCSYQPAEGTSQYEDLGVCIDISDVAPTPKPTTKPVLAGNATCKGNCGGAGTGGCYCDGTCVSYNDCCADYALECGSQSCAGRCGKAYIPGELCYCDNDCVKQGDCCDDFPYVCQGMEAGTCRGRCGQVGDHWFMKTAGNASQTEEVSRTVNGCRCKAKWSPACAPNIVKNGCPLNNACPGGSPCDTDADCPQLGDWRCVSGYCYINFNASQSIAPLPLKGPTGLRWCEIEDPDACTFSPPDVTWDYCVPKRAQADTAARASTDLTVGGCACKASWSPSFRECSNRFNDVFQGCGMHPACDGWDAGMAGMSWCEIEPSPSCQPSSRSLPSRDLCVPDRSFQRADLFPADSPEATGIGQMSIHGCQCKAVWVPSTTSKGNVCPSVTRVKGCLMDPPCDGDGGRIGGSWCEVEDPDLCAIPLPVDPSFDQRCGIKINREYSNTSLAEFPDVQTYAECCEACSAREDCTHWTWYNTQALPFFCTLKTSASGERAPTLLAGDLVVSGTSATELPGIPCTTDGDCTGSNSFCSSGTCRFFFPSGSQAPCGSGRPCASNEVCVTGKCRLRCSASSQCTTPETCLGTGASRYCGRSSAASGATATAATVSPCGTSCVDNAGCPAGSVCVGNKCRTACVSDSDCPTASGRVGAQVLYCNLPGSRSFLAPNNSHWACSCHCSQLLLFV